MRAALLTIAALTWFPYAAAFFPGPAGNPDRQPYAGQPDSVYDAAANPPRTAGMVSYNPSAPLAQQPQNNPPGQPAP